MQIIPQIIDAIKRHPNINRIVVSRIEWLLIKRKIRKLSLIRPAKRPTYGPPFGDIDRDLWDMNFRHMRDITPIFIMGRRVEYE